MLACFTRGSGLDGRGAKRHRIRLRMEGHHSYLANPSPEEEEQVYSQLSALKDRMPTRHRDNVEEVLLGAGANGLAFVEGPRVSVAFEGDIAVYFQGRLLAELADSVESFAHEILHRYQSRQITGGDPVDLGVLDGDFALIIFDKLAGCVLAARDPRGAESLFWGTSNFGEMLLFSNDATLLEGTCADVDAFPSGTMFCSRNGEVTGELTMLVSDDAREDAFLDDDVVDFLVGDDLAAAVARAEDGGWENSRGDAPLARKLEPLQNLLRVESNPSPRDGSDISLHDLGAHNGVPSAA